MHERIYEAEGLEVPVETRGSAPETLVFLPGLGCSPALYRDGLELASRRLRIVVPDLSFRRSARLPTDLEGYRRVVTSVCERAAPGAPWSGHSFGGLLALLRPAPAIACAPSVAADVPFVRMFGRALLLQAREYLGLEGRAARACAFRLMRDYVTQGLTGPRALFGPIGGLDAPPTSLTPTTPRAVVYLANPDVLYRDSDYAAYFEGIDPSRIDMRRVNLGHDWPMTHGPELADRLLAAWETLHPAKAAPHGASHRTHPLIYES